MGDRVDLLLYGRHIIDVKDLSVPLAHGGLESAKLLIVSRPHAYDLIGRQVFQVIRSLQNGTKQIHHWLGDKHPQELFALWVGQ